MSSKLDNLLFHFNQLSEAEQAKFIAAGKTSGHVSHFVSGFDREAIWEGRSDYLPSHYSQVPVLWKYGSRAFRTAQRHSKVPLPWQRLRQDVFRLDGVDSFGHEERLSSLETLRKVYDGRAFREEVSRDL